MDTLIAFAPREHIPHQIISWLERGNIQTVYQNEQGVNIDVIVNTAARFVLIDLEFQESGDLDFLEEIRNRSPLTRIIVMTTVASDSYLRALHDAGAHGVVLKRPYVSDLMDAFSSVSSGGAYITGHISPRDGVTLTPSEHRILLMIAEGMNNKEISAAINRCVKTIESHRARLFRRLGAKNAPAAVMTAIRMGLIGT